MAGPLFAGEHPINYRNVLTQQNSVVVADDDPAARRFVAALLRRHRYEVYEAADGQEAFEQIEQFRPDMVVVDWEMPRLSGIELCRRLRLESWSERLFILMLTARTHCEDLVDALQSGADDFLTKPFVAGELIARLQCGMGIRDLHGQLRRAKNDADTAIDALQARAHEIVATRDLAVFALAKLAESRDTETGEHLERLRSYSQILAEHLSQHGPYRDQIDDQFLQDLYRSSPLHDIGKVGIPDAILHKPGKLDAAEFEIMKQHASIGADALEKAVHFTGAGDFLSMAVEIARYHHERFDGSGYPCGLKGREIPLAARIVALADVYDALTSVRVYKPAFSPGTARTMIEEQDGRHFDPAVVEAFRARFEDFLSVRNQTADEPELEASLGTA